MTHYAYQISVYIYLELFTLAFLGNGARNVCWHFLMSSLEMDVLSPSLATALEMLVDIS